MVGINSRVVVGRTQQAHHAFALRNALATEVVYIFQCHPAGYLHRGIVAQELLDGVGDEFGLGLEQR